MTLSVANGGFLLTSGRLSDLYGRRRVFLCGSVLYFIFTILCGFSQNGIMLFVFRAFQGLANAISVPGAVGIVGATYHRYGKRKSMAFAIIGSLATTGFLTGILLGGICSQLLTWRWVFYISAILAAIAISSALFIVPKMAGEEPENPDFPKSREEIDWLGQLLSISGLTLLSFSLTYFLRCIALTTDTHLRHLMGGQHGTLSSFSSLLSFCSDYLSGLSINEAIKR